jgi:hypothetical protein
MKNVAHEFVEKIKTQRFVFSNMFRENDVVYETMWKKYCRAGQATDDNVALALRMLNT